uniref:protein-tyrosine-phosphatase n=1 Tax=Lygus hesperus TaxID=30085 RepID=A0A0A9XU25_LYGHE
MGGATGIYTIRLIDCFGGLNKAFYFNMVDFGDFDLTEYETYEGANPHAEGDLSWIVPEKLLAFAGPCGERNGNWPVEVYLGYFKERNVYTVIRLNKSRYDRTRFTSHGIDHYDLIFPDGSTPPDDILNDFLEIVENTEGATAVHCKAGLGRTGCLIGIYLMKLYRMTASEAIAWMRICRPGCVIGQQQTWLEGKQLWAWEQGRHTSRPHLREFGEGPTTQIRHLLPQK